jgi:DNA-binding CsgD family transcriptional regulator/tetratricopeptide (TPR) repeat protein
MEALSRAPFVGRERELAQLERCLDAVKAGRGASVLLLGDPGIGKTRMVEELARRSRAHGFDLLTGRAIDFVGTELPYQPLVEALPPLGELRRADGLVGSQLRVFELALTLLTDCADETPVLLVLEDVHWADTSTLDLLVYLAHNLDEPRVLLVVTARADEPASGARMRHLAERLRRTASALVLELGPLERDELIELLAARPERPPAAMADAIARRSEGNPFFAEELLALPAANEGDLPANLRGLLLQRVARLDSATQGLLRPAAAVGRDVDSRLLLAVTDMSERDARDSLRRAVEHGVLVADQARGTFRFRHALLADAVYATILPGEREALHARLADELARSGTATAGEIAPHWAAAGRTREALAASIEAAREAEAAFGLAEALAHLERVIGSWREVADAPELAGIDLVGVCSWAAGLASKIEAGPRAIELGRQAIDLLGADNPRRAASLHVSLGEYLYEIGNDAEGLAELARAVELVPAQPSSDRAYALGSFAGGLMVAGRHAESLPIAEEALALSERVGGREAEVRALTVIGVDLAHLGFCDDGVARLRRALQLAEEIGDEIGLDRAYVNLTSVLTMLGRNVEAAQLGQEGLEVMRQRGTESSLILANWIEALVAIGSWDEADRLVETALRRPTSSFSFWLLLLAADLAIGRGDFDSARLHLEAARPTVPEENGLGVYQACLAELALWEHRWADAVESVEDGLTAVPSYAPGTMFLRLYVDGLRAQAELVALARARRDARTVADRQARAHELLAGARRAGTEACAITPDGGGWLVLAEAEYERVLGSPRTELWTQAAETWLRLGRPFLAAYCRWRLAETLVRDGSSRTEASAPLAEAYAVATRLGARPLLRQLELLAERARLNLSPVEVGAPGERSEMAEALGLTAREIEVLGLVARGLTNREIAAMLVISVKTASAHVSHILRKLDAPNRREAAAIAHRLAPPLHDGRPAADR